jgi:hypothetical protein
MTQQRRARHQARGEEKLQVCTKNKATSAIATATNAAPMANHTWLVRTLANIRPASAPPNAPTTTIPRTLAEAKPMLSPACRIELQPILDGGWDLTQVAAWWFRATLRRPSYAASMTDH